MLKVSENEDEATQMTFVPTMVVHNSTHLIFGIEFDNPDLMSIGETASL